LPASNPPGHVAGLLDAQAYLDSQFNHRMKSSIQICNGKSAYLRIPCCRGVTSTKSRLLGICSRFSAWQGSHQGTVAGYSRPLGLPASVIMRVTDDELAFGIEFRPGCHAAWRAKNGRLSGLWVQFPNVAGPRVLGRPPAARSGRRLAAGHCSKRGTRRCRCYRNWPTPSAQMARQRPRFFSALATCD
jgi:hypothetical protein